MTDAVATVVDAEPAARPATELWCFICRTWRPYRNQALPTTSFRGRPGWDAETLICRGCATTLLVIRAPSPPDEA